MGYWFHMIWNNKDIDVEIIKILLVYACNVILLFFLIVSKQ